MNKKTKNKQKILSRTLGTARGRGEQYGTLEKENKELKEKLSQAEGRESIELFLKNEAYSFLLSEGLIDKFLEYRKNSQTSSKQQAAAYFLTISANLGGLWIDA